MNTEPGAIATGCKHRYINRSCVHFNCAVESLKPMTFLNITLLAELRDLTEPGIYRHVAPTRLSVFLVFSVVNHPLKTLHSEQIDLCAISKHQLQLRKERIQRLLWTNHIRLAEIADVRRAVARTVGEYVAKPTTGLER